MSHEASSWALKQRVQRGPKLLLLVLANHADKRGVCFPGQEGLAEECVCGERTVRRDMQDLEEVRLLARARRTRSDGSRTSDWIVLAPGGDRGDMQPPTEPDYPQEVVVLAGGGLPANLAGSATGQSGQWSPVSGESSEAQASSSENPPTSPKGTAGGSPPPQPSPLRARSRARGAGPDQDRAALDRLAVPLRPFVVPVRRVLLRIAETKTGSYEPTVAAICAALAAHPRKDFLPEASKYEHWALHGAGRDQRVKDVVRQFRNWIDRAPDVLRRTPPMSAGGGDDATGRLREHLRPRLLEEGGFKNSEIDAMTDTQLRVAEAEL